ARRDGRVAGPLREADASRGEQRRLSRASDPGDPPARAARRRPHSRARKKKCGGRVDSAADRSSRPCNTSRERTGTSASRLRPATNHGDTTMRFLITAAPCENDATSGAEKPVDEKVLAAYMKYNEDMTRAGVLIASEGLLPNGFRARVALSQGK